MGMPRDTDRHFNQRNRQLLTRWFGEREDITAFIAEIGASNPRDVEAALRQFNGALAGLSPRELRESVSRLRRRRRNLRSHEHLRSARVSDQGGLRVWRA